MIDPSTSTTPAKGLFARAIGMFSSPRATYQTIVAHPRSVGIMLITIVLLVVGQGGPQFTAAGQQAMMDARVRQSEAGGQQLSEQQIDTMNKMLPYFAYFTVGGIILVAPLIVMVFAGLYWLIFNVILGGMATFRQVMSIVAHSSVIGAVGAALGAPIMMAQGKFPQAGPFNLGALAAGADPTGFASHFLTSIAIFQIWGIVVTSIGLSVLYRKKTGAIATTLLVLYFGFTAGMVALFGKYMA